MRLRARRRDEPWTPIETYSNRWVVLSDWVDWQVCKAEQEAEGDRPFSEVEHELEGMRDEGPVQRKLREMEWRPRQFAGLEAARTGAAVEGVRVPGWLVWDMPGQFRRVGNYGYVGMKGWLMENE